MSEEPMRRSRRMVEQGLIVGGLGALMFFVFDSLWTLVVVGLGAMLLFAGLIGEAVRGPNVAAPEEPRRPWDDR